MSFINIIKNYIYTTKYKREKDVQQCKVLLPIIKKKSKVLLPPLILICFSPFIKALGRQADHIHAIEPFFIYKMKKKKRQL